MIKYLGSKRTLIPLLVEVVRRAGPVSTVLDLFSGTSRVGLALKAEGYRVLANDQLAYAATLARCYVQADAEDHLENATRLIREFNAQKGSPGYFTETFCVRSRFIQPKNGERVDAIREAIARKGLSPELEAVLLVALMEAADRVDSTTGVQMAYLKSWAPRSFEDLELRVPELLPRARHGKGQASCLDAFEAARAFDADLVYIDPPYNHHSYLGNYHIWESLVRWDKPPVYGVACKRIDVKERRTVFNSRPRHANAMRELFATLRAPVLVVSFNDEGFVSRAEMEAMLRELWNGEACVTTIERDSKRYVGAQIGIHDGKGRKVGAVSHLRNTEFTYVASCRDLSGALADIARPAGEQRQALGAPEERWT